MSDERETPKDLVTGSTFAPERRYRAQFDPRLLSPQMAQRLRALRAQAEAEAQAELEVEAETLETAPSQGRLYRIVLLILVLIMLLALLAYSFSGLFSYPQIPTPIPPSAPMV